MSAVERPTDGPDTELAAAIAWVQSCDIAPGDLTAWMRDSPKTRSHVETIVRAVLARPAAGRDLTGQDVWDAMEQGAQRGARLGTQVIADYLNEIARPAVALTDGQPPADEPRSSRWLVKDGPDSILGSFATRSAAEEAQERVRPAYPTAWVEEYPARAAAPADDTAAPDMPAIVAGVERSYVEALNAILAAPGGSDDVDRWRGQAEAYRTVAERLRRDHGMARVEYGSGEWRRTHGVQPVRDSQDGGDRG